MSYVYVSCEVPLIEIPGGVVVSETARGVYEAMDVETYRKWKRLGHFKRLMAPRRRFGRDFLIDANWVAENEPHAPLPPGTPKPKPRGCGCGGKAR